MKQAFYHAVLCSILAMTAADIYKVIYCSSLSGDFSQIINEKSIAIASVAGCFLISFGNLFFSKIMNKNADAWFNVILLFLTFASLVSSFAVTLPLSVEMPELFPGLSVPMHFFPCLFWLATKSIFMNGNGKKRLLHL